MSINVSQGFKRTSANPIDESLTLTKAQMKAVNDNLMPAKWFTIGQDDGKIYLYDKTNTVDETTGKFRKFEGGGTGGASELADLEDVLLTSLANGQTLVWDDTNSKWVNAAFPTVPTKLSELTNDSGFITKVVNDLVNYYLKTETYSKSEVDTIVAAVKNSRFEFVNSLPTTNIKTNVIYLVPKQDAETGDIKDEYINLDGTSSAWEKIGSTAIDLTDYVTVNDLNTALANYVTSTDLTALLDAKQDKVQYSTLPMASADNLGEIVQYIGATGNGLTHGYYYECKESNGSYSWVQTNVQPSGGGGGGHTIEDSEGTELTQRDTMQFGEGFVAEDDATNEKTVVSVDEMPAEDMSEIINGYPTGGKFTVTGYTPLGTILPYYGEVAPKFYLVCDGTAYNKVDYPELANHLLSLTNHSEYEVDGDNTKFKVPDLRGEFIRGTGTNGHTDQGSGAAVGVHQNGTLIQNLRSVTDSGFGLLAYGKSTNIINKNMDSSVDDSTLARYLNSNYTNTDVSMQDKPTLFSARPTNTSVLFCIAYKDIYSNPMNDYSTTEKVVGTWIDGKPVYQKTVDVTVPSTTDGTAISGYVDISALNVYYTLKVTGVDKQTGVAVLFDPVFITNSGLFVKGLIDTNGEHLTVWTNCSAYSNRTYHVTLQYTKTTD